MEVNVKLVLSLCLNIQYLRSSVIEIALSLNEMNSKSNKLLHKE